MIVYDRISLSRTGCKRVVVGNHALWIRSGAWAQNKLWSAWPITRVVSWIETLCFAVPFLALPYRKALGWNEGLFFSFLFFASQTFIHSQGGIRLRSSVVRWLMQVGATCHSPNLISPVTCFANKLAALLQDRLAYTKILYLLMKWRSGAPPRNYS